MGNRLLGGSGPLTDAKRATQVQKWSFRRACKSGIFSSTSTCHGRLMHLNDFPLRLVQSLQAKAPTAQIRPQPEPVRRHKHLTVLQRNPGAMFQGSLLELKLWLALHPTDIVRVDCSMCGCIFCRAIDIPPVYKHVRNKTNQGAKLICGTRWTTSYPHCQHASS